MTLMTKPPGRNSQPPDDPVPDPASGERPRSQPSLAAAGNAAGVAPASGEPAASVHRNGSNSKLVVALLVGVLGLFGTNVVYTGSLIQGLGDRIDFVAAELRDDIRESEARQNARIDALAVELRESEVRQNARIDALAVELRESEVRLNARIDALAVEVRRIAEVLADIQARLKLIEAAFAQVDAGFVRLETTAGLPPLPVAPSGGTSSDDG